MFSILDNQDQSVKTTLKLLNFLAAYFEILTTRPWRNLDSHPYVYNY